VPNGNRNVAMLYTDSAGTNEVLYLHDDHLGSVNVITDKDGKSVDDRTYDAFGVLAERPGFDLSKLVRLGFSGHEDESDTGLVNMGGRMYDPYLARFTSADPFVQNPWLSQSRNRYSYVFNNPMTLVDPSGFLADDGGGENGGEPPVGLSQYDLNLTATYEPERTPVDPAGGPGATPLEQPNPSTPPTNDQWRDSGSGTEPGWGTPTYSGVPAPQLQTPVAPGGGATAGSMAGSFAQGFGEGWASGVLTPMLPPYMLYQGVQQVAGLAAFVSDPSGVLNAMTANDWARMAGNIAPNLAGGIYAGWAGVCFAPGTQIATADGFVTIEDLVVGDEVWAYNPETGEAELRKVTAAHKRDTDSLVHLRAGGEWITTTPEHPFWVDGQGWKVAGDLAVGELLLGLDGTAVQVEAIAAEAGPATVYNLDVEGLHTYFVTEAELLVHNCEAGTSTLPGALQGATVATEQTPLITFGHGARHLVGTVLGQSVVEQAITQDILQGVRGASVTGSFWGRIPFGSSLIEYRAFTPSPGWINVGTYYYPPVSP